MSCTVNQLRQIYYLQERRIHKRVAVRPKSLFFKCLNVLSFELKEIGTNARMQRKKKSR